jgi:cytochrome c-type protein NapB
MPLPSRQAGSVNSLKPHTPRRDAFLQRNRPLLALLMLSFVVAGCSDKHAADSDNVGKVSPSSSTERSLRRAYDGAPPVIPHPRLGALCIECHTSTGKSVPDRGFAPANPHALTTGLSQTANCRQCHVFHSTNEMFAESDFSGLAQSLQPGERLYSGAPPVMPHAIFMRENCTACHSGPAARPEIRCSHPERARCTQCHVPQQKAAEEFPLVAR